MKKRPRVIVRACLIALAAAALLESGCSRPLPEAESAEARLYIQYCGGCHGPYQPGLQTAAMWEVTLARMESTLMRTAGIRLGEADRRTIIAYLTRNAGGH